MPEARGEFARIAALLAGLPRGEGVVVGPGDDAAVLRLQAGYDLVVTTDAFVEGRHFRRDLLSPAEVGVRLAAANLSDLAAMAALPRWALLSLIVPATWSAADATTLEHACARALAAEGASVVGGNLASGEGGFSATVTLLGEVERDRAWTRSGARACDVLAVTGAPGSAAAALALALASEPPSWSHVPEALAALFRSPPPRVRLARALAGNGGVRAAIDLSDGLAADLAHLCAASGVGARVDEACLPALARAHAWSPSDDYELLLALSPEAWEGCAGIAATNGVPLTRIGVFTASPELRVRDEGGGERTLEPVGWDHFPAG